MNEVYLNILEQKIKDTWFNWTQAEKKSREAKAAYDAAMREMTSYEIGVEEQLRTLESRGGTI